MILSFLVMSNKIYQNFDIFLEIYDLPLAKASGLLPSFPPPMFMLLLVPSPVGVFCLKKLFATSILKGPLSCTVEFKFGSLLKLLNFFLLKN